MKEQVREEPKIVAAAEKQMRAWAKSSESVQVLCDSVAVGAKIHPYVAISREAGAGGSTVGQILGNKLGWEVFDRNIIDRVAERYHVSRPMLEMVDETQSNWVFDVLGTWMDQKLVPHERFVSHLTHVIHAIASHSSAVYIGRGVQFLLPRDRGLTVRIVASESYRAKRIAERFNISVREARQKMIEVDKGRSEFVQRFFHHDIDNPHIYDLVINVERCGYCAAADCIIAVLDR